MSRSLRHALGILGLATACMLAVIGVRQIGAVPEGLRAQYFSNAQPGAPPALSVVDREPSSDYVFADFRGSPPQSFTASWNGWVVALRRGAYTFATETDQASSVAIDGRPLVESAGGRREPARGTITLERGTHSVLLRYVHTDGVPDVEFLWARDKGPLEEVPGWALRPRAIPYVRFVSDRALDDLEIAGLVAWCLAVIGVAVAAGWRTLAPVRAAIVEEPAWPFLACAIAGSVALALVGIGWGLPELWVGDELVPADIILGLRQHFSHGWFSIYPPVHFYLLAAAYLPVIAVGQLGLLGLHTTLAHTLMILTGRLISVVMEAGLLLATFLAGRRAFGWWAGLFAALTLALAAPFVYYSKTANVEVPYMFWLAGTLALYLRVLSDEASVSDYAWWAVFGTLAICTKDQVYAFCLPMPFVVVYEMWRRNVRDGRPHAFGRTLSDRRLLTAGAVALALFALCQNLLFNASGFVQHVAFITGRKVESYRAFEPSLAGRLALARVTVRLAERLWGWPILLVAVSGTIVALASSRYRRTAIWLLIPVVSYYLGFIDIVLYNYDRFMMPVGLVMALFGGMAVAQFTARAPTAHAWRLAVVAAVFAYTLLYGGTVDALMLRDSRYTVERWLTERVRAGDVVASSGLPRYLPRLDRFRGLDVDHLETLLEARPAYFVVNADYTRSEPPNSPLGRLLSALRSGKTDYRLVLSARTPSPWPWLPGADPDLVGSRLDGESLSFLRNVNPTIEVFARP